MSQLASCREPEVPLLHNRRLHRLLQELERSYTLSTPGGSSPVCCPPCSPPPAPAAYISSARASSRRLAGSGLGGPTSPERDPLGRLLRWVTRCSSLSAGSLTTRWNPPYFCRAESSSESLIPSGVFCSLILAFALFSGWNDPLAETILLDINRYDVVQWKILCRNVARFN